MASVREWQFKRKFRTNAYGWRASSLAIGRLKAAAAEAGFAGVECASPYEHDAKDVARRYLDGVCRNVTDAPLRAGTFSGRP